MAFNTCCVLSFAIFSNVYWPITQVSFCPLSHLLFGNAEERQTHLPLMGDS
jgi:hypothetical protein